MPALTHATGRGSGHANLAIPGPTNMPARVRQAMDIPLEDHRAPNFGDFTLPLFADLKKIFKTEAGHVLTFSGSGTLGWESAIANTLSPGDRVLAAVFGQFSHLWADMCRSFQLDVHDVDVPWGQGVPLDAYERAIAADTAHEIKAVLVCHNETATGVTSDVAAVRTLLDAHGHPALLFVDGVSSVGSIEFRMDDWGVDVIVAGSQKGFMLPTGLAIVGISQKALEAGKTAKLPRSFLDYQAMIAANASGYFPYTPATTLLRGLRASVDMLLEEGLENVWARHNRLAEGVRQATRAWDLELCAQSPDLYSDTVSAIVVPDTIDANDVIKAAYHDYGLSLGGGLSKVAGRVFRIGHLGSLNELMVLQAISGAELAMRDVGIAFEPGSGVGAAITHFSKFPLPTAASADPTLDAVAA
ncbi:MAG: aminotransferase class V-fold PLP-dependent enzyme [Pseudomonadota bacterium]